MSLSSYTPAPVRAGMARKNDSRVAATRVAPWNRPAEIVAPERDTPGTSATHWNRPMTSTCRRVSSSSVYCRVRAAADASARYMTRLQTIRAPATTHRLRSGPDTKPLAARPTTTIGTDPTMTAQANR